VRIAALRRRLGLDPFAPWPLFKPWSRRRWYERLAELQRLEALAYDRGDEQMLELERLSMTDLEP
jgi:hypothetical protein